MSHDTINFKIDPELKKLAVRAADKLGVSIDVVLNSELQRFAAEQRLIFTVPETPVEQTAKQLAASKKQIEANNYHRFDSNEQALKLLTEELK